MSSYQPRYFYIPNPMQYPIHMTSMLYQFTKTKPSILKYSTPYFQGIMLEYGIKYLRAMACSKSKETFLIFMINPDDQHTPLKVQPTNLVFLCKKHNTRYLQTTKIIMIGCWQIVSLNSAHYQFIKSQTQLKDLNSIFKIKSNIPIFLLIFRKSTPFLLMGNSSTQGQLYDQFDPSHWVRNEKIRHLFVLNHRNNPEFQIQKYPVSINDDREYAVARDMFHIRKSDPDFIATLYFDLWHNKQLCSKNYSGFVFTERIPLRLSDLMDIPFPDVLHVYNQTLNGFQRLFKMFGPFQIFESLIGVNNKNIVKVWHSSHFQIIEPQSYNDTQIDMVRYIIMIIERATNSLSMPPQEPSFQRFVYRESEWMGFGEAKRKLQKYANLYNDGIMPTYLQCVVDVGGTHQILEKRMQLMYPEPQNINKKLNPNYQQSFPQKASSIKPPINNGQISQNSVPIRHLVHPHPMQPKILDNPQMRRQQTRTISQPSPIPSYQTPILSNPAFHNNSQNNLTRSFVIPQPAIKPTSFHHKPYSHNLNINKSNSSSNIHRNPQYFNRVSSGSTINFNNKYVQNHNPMNNQTKFEETASKLNNEGNVTTFRRPINFTQNYGELKKDTQSTPAINLKPNNFMNFPNPQNNIKEVPIPAKSSSKKSSPILHKEQQGRQELLNNEIKTQDIKSADDKLLVKNISGQRHPIGAISPLQRPSFEYKPNPQSKNIYEVNQFRMNSYNYNPQPEDASPKFSEINPSISSIGLGQIKSGYQDFSMEDTTKNLCNNLKMSEQLQSDYGYTKVLNTHYDYGIQSKSNKKKFDTGYSDNNFIQSLKISQKNQIPSPPKVYEDYSYFDVGKTHKESQIQNKTSVNKDREIFTKQANWRENNKLAFPDGQFSYQSNIPQSTISKEKSGGYEYKYNAYQPYQNHNNNQYNYKSNIGSKGAWLDDSNNNFNNRKVKSHNKQSISEIYIANYEYKKNYQEKQNAYTPYTRNYDYDSTDGIIEKEKEKNYQSSIDYKYDRTDKLENDEYQFQWDPQIWADLKKLSAEQ